MLGLLNRLHNMGLTLLSLSLRRRRALTHHNQADDSLPGNMTVMPVCPAQQPGGTPCETSRRRPHESIHARN